jgi:hypothetical protein
MDVDHYLLFQVAKMGEFLPYTFFHEEMSGTATSSDLVNCARQLVFFSKTTVPFPLHWPQFDAVVLGWDGLQFRSNVVNGVGSCHSWFHHSQCYHSWWEGVRDLSLKLAMLKRNE